MWLNVCGLTEEKLTELLSVMRHDSVHILHIIDARVHPHQLRWYKRQITMALGPATSIICAHLTSVNKSAKAHVGGQLTIIRSHAGSVFYTHRDPSQLGVVLTLGIRILDTNYYISSVYMPPSTRQEHNCQDSLAERLQAYLHNTHQDITPTQYVERQLATAADKARRHDSIALIGGDFNGGFFTQEGTYLGLQEWASLNQLRHCQSTQTPTPPTFYRGTWISSLDHILMSDTCTTVSNFEVHHWLPLSDHAPVSVDVRARLPNLPSLSPQPRITPRSSSALRTPRAKERFLKFIRRAPNPSKKMAAALKDGPQAVGLTLESISLTSASCAAHANNYSIPPGKNCWSPEYVAHTSALRAWKSIRRGLSSDSQRRHWTTHVEQQRGVEAALTKWERQIKEVARSPTELTHLLGISGTSPRQCRLLSVRLLATQSRYMEDFLLHRLHGRQRMEMRQRFLLHSIRRQRDVTTHLSRVLRSMLGDRINPRKRQSPFEMHSLTFPDGSVISQPSQVHHTVTSFFNEWFSTDPLEMTQRFPQTLASNVFNDEAQMRARLHAACVPESVQSLLWQAIQRPQAHLSQPLPSGLTLREHMALDLQRCPSFEEFRAAISSTKKGSSGGMTGLSYDQLKLLPSAWLHAIYDGLAALWPSKHIPDFFTLKWLVPIPKKDDPTLADLRPLALVEVLRKAWVSIIIKRIGRHWIQHSLLHPSQHGFLHARGTDTAYVQTLAKIESARLSGLPLYASSFDVKRAFDRPEKQILVQSLARLGVPSDIAQYIVAFDTLGATVVRSPLAEAQFRRHGREAFQTCFPSVPSDDDGSYFVAQRGTGQGDVSSPLNWNAVTDVMLCALQPLQSVGHRQSSDPLDTVFADDILCTSTSVPRLQEKADIISAFSILIGLTLTPEKFRAFMSTHCTRDHTTPSTPSIVLHGPHWHNSTSVTLAPGQTVKYLGVNLDIDTGWQSQYELSVTNLKADLNSVMRRMASSTLKNLTATVCILPRHCYTAALASIPLSHLRKLEQQFNKFNRVITKNRQTFPTALLYLPTIYGGLGLRSFTDTVVSRKFGMLQRSLHGDTAASAAANQLLQHPSTKRFWTEPLVSLASELGWLLYCSNSPKQPVASSNLSHFLFASVPGILHQDLHALLSSLKRQNIVCPHDLIDDHGFLQPWATQQWPALSSIPTSALPISASNRVTSLMPGQLWYRRKGHQRISDSVEVFDVVNFDAYTRLLTIRQWRHTPSDAVIKAGSVITAHRSDTEGITQLMLDELFSPATDWYQLYAKPIPSVKSASLQRKKITHLQFRRHPPASAAAPSPATWFLPIPLSEDTEYDIYTDGTWAGSGDLLPFLSPQISRSTSAAAALVIQPSHDPWDTAHRHTIRITNGDLIQATSAFPMELLAISAALHLAQDLHISRIISDSKSSIDLITGIRAVHTFHQKQYFALIKAARLLYSRVSSRTTLVHVKSHPEKRHKSPDSWTRDEVGNDLADKLAGLKFSSLFNTPHFAVSAAEITIQLVSHIGWHWRDSTTGLPIMQPFHMAVAARRAHDYCCRRNPQPSQSISHDDHLWTPQAMRTMSRWSNLSALSLPARASALRILYDWDYNGRKRLQASPDSSEESGFCLTCKQHVLDDSSHWIAKCPHPDLTQLRSDTMNLAREKADTFRNSPELHKYLTCFLDLATVHPLRHLIWKGHFPRTLSLELHTALPAPDPRSLLAYDKALLSVGRILWNGTHALRQRKHFVESGACSATPFSPPQPHDNNQFREQYRSLRRKAPPWSSSPPLLPTSPYSPAQSTSLLSAHFPPTTSP